MLLSLCPKMFSFWNATCHRQIVQRSKRSSCGHFVVLEEYRLETFEHFASSNMDATLCQVVLLKPLGGII